LDGEIVDIWGGGKPYPAMTKYNEGILDEDSRVGSSIFREGEKPYPAIPLLNLLVQKQPKAA